MGLYCICGEKGEDAAFAAFRDERPGVKLVTEWKGSTCYKKFDVLDYDVLISCAVAPLSCKNLFSP